MSARAGRRTGALRRGNALLRMHTEGQGRPVLVLGSARYYPRTFSAGLRRHCELSFADLRHFAETAEASASAPPTLADYVADIDAIQSALGIERCVLLGHSHHGNVALEYARGHPQRVAQLVLIGTPPGDVATTLAAGERYWHQHASPARRRRLAQRRAALAATSSSGEPDFVTSYVAEAPRYWYAPCYDASWLWQDVPVNLPALTAFKQFFDDYDFPAVAAQLTHPVLAITGRHDYVVPPTLWADREHLLTNLQLHVLDRSGHTPQLEQPQRFDALLLDWLASDGR